MTVKFLLDTNAVSEPLKPKPNYALLNHLRTHETELAIPALVWHELLFGSCLLPEGKKRAIVKEYLTAIAWVIYPYDAAAAHWHAEERARLAQIGKMPSFVDGQIAAIAVTKNLSLVTFNIKDFRNFKGLSLVDWRK